MPSVDIKSGGIYCRKCGYDLRGQAESHRCPECGQGFDPADRKTFRTRPPRGAAWRWVKRGVVFVLAVGILLGVCWGWLYWGWKNEQATVAKMWASVEDFKPLGGEKLQSCLRSSGWVLNRVTFIMLPEPTTDADLIHLKELQGLQMLSLRETQVTDAGLVHLKGIAGLQLLDLASTNVTDAGLVHLKELKALHWLNLPGTKVTTAGVKDLQTALPGTQIFWP